MLAVAPLRGQVLAVPTATALPGGAPAYVRAVRVADVDRDGVPDAIVVGDGDPFFVCRGDGNGQFGVTAGNAGAFFVSDVHLSDFAHDGRVDLAIGGVAYNQVLPGDGLGGFGPPVPLPPIGTRFVACDWNGDGLLDLIAPGLPTIRWAAGTAAGGFAAPVEVPLPAGLPPLFGAGTILAGDVDADGAIDLVIGAGLGAPVVLRGDGAGGVAGGQALPGALFHPQALVDLDGDGDLDLVARFVDGSVQVGHNDGAGTFGPATIVPGVSSDELLVVDLDGDGVADLVARAGSSVVVLRGIGDGTFGAPEVHTMGPLGGIAVGDFDGDGRTDVVAAGPGQLYLLRNLLPAPVGIARYGYGTPACPGAIGATGSRSPRVGADDFRVVFANAPADARGVLAIGWPAVAGWTGLGLRLHLWLPAPIAALRSDPGGAASGSLPIPALPALAGLSLHLQSYWLADGGRGDTCSPAALELASSVGLRVTIQP